MYDKFETESEYDSWFDEVFSKLVRGVEDHQFHHFNRSMGIHIYGKDHYKQELKRRRMIPYDVMEEFAEDWDKNNKRKEYGGLSAAATNIVHHLKHSADKYGNLRLGENAIKAMVEIGAIKPRSNFVPEGSVQGGFNG